MHFKLIFTIVSCLLLYSVNSFSQKFIGQPQLDYTPKSSDIQLMQKAVDFPINYFNGSVDINIPFYTVKSRSLTLPLSVQYNTGGIKADQQSSCIGLGWLLQAGGSITRTPRGNFDEGVQIEIRQHPRFLNNGPSVFYVWATMRDSLANVDNAPGGYYVNGGFNSQVQSLSTSIIAHNNTIANGQVPWQPGPFPLLANGLLDGESDIYYYNFGTYSGRFIFDRFGQPTLVPYNKDLKIVPVLDRISDTTVGIIANANHTRDDTTILAHYYFKSFIVSTPDGKDYYFGETQESRNCTQYGNDYSMPNGWYLTKVVDKNIQDTIYINYINRTQQFLATAAYRQKFVRAYDIQIGQCVNTTSWGDNTAYQNVTEVLPQSITTAKEKVLFYYHSSNNLDSIKVTDINTGKPYQKIQFINNSFLSRKTMLSGLVIKDLISNEIYPYKFGYYDTVGYKGIFGQDFWGYQNRADNNNTLFMSYPGCSNGANRMPAWPEMKIHALTEVTYPTGKRTEYQYEPHRVYTGRMYNRTIGDIDLFHAPYHFINIGDSLGGLRVKKVLNYDPITKDTLIKTIRYEVFDQEVSSGHLHIPPSLIMAIPSFACNSGGITGMPEYFLSTHNLFKDNENGNYITYRNVTIKEEKGTINNGYTRYEFYNDVNTDSSLYLNICDGVNNSCLIGNYDVYPSWQPRHAMTNLASGLLKSESVYNASNQLVTRKQYLYQTRVYPGISRNAVINYIKATDVCGNGYPIIVPPGYANGPVPAPPGTYYYFYSYTTGKKAIMLQKGISEYYAADGSYSKDTVVYNYENSVHINPTQEIRIRSNGDTLKKQLLYALDFSDINNGDSSFYFMKKAFYNPEIASFNYINSAIISGGYKNIGYKSRLDSSCFLLKNDYQLNRTSGGLSPTAINISGPFPKSYNFPSASFQHIASYLYNPGNAITRVVKKGQDRHAIIWDYNNYFPVAEASNADTNDIAFTSFETSNTGRWIVSSLSRVTGESLTGQVCYNLINGNITCTGLNSSKRYFVSYWSRSASANVNSIAATTGITKNGWTYFQHSLSAGTTQVAISGNVVIDELRLYPTTSLMKTVSYEPMLGEISINSPDNIVEYHEYDGLSNLRVIRDADRNITKAWEAFFTRFPTNLPEWRNTGNQRLKPCVSNPAYNAPTWQYEQVDINPNSSTYNNATWLDGSSCNCSVNVLQTLSVFRCAKSGGTNTGYQEQAKIDVNPCSPTYNDTTWVNIGLNTTACPLCPPNWQNTATTIRCKKDVNNINTGEQEQEQVDISTCSPTYNTTRWVVVGTNTTACPLCAPNWQFTPTPIRCKKDANNQNTSEQEREQRDIAPCSSTYNQKRWVVVGTNMSACPLP